FCGGLHRGGAAAIRISFPETIQLSCGFRVTRDVFWDDFLWDGQRPDGAAGFVHHTVADLFGVYAGGSLRAFSGLVDCDAFLRGRGDWRGDCGDRHVCDGDCAESRARKIRGDHAGSWILRGAGGGDIVAAVAADPFSDGGMALANGYRRARASADMVVPAAAA